MFANAFGRLVKARPWHVVALVGVLLLAFFFYFFRLAQEGYGNLYYAAAVKSMMTSLHNFFYVSFDPGGFVSVDKPPLGLWVQAFSATVFGFDGWSLLFPQALAGVLSVALLYYLVRRVFGPTAGVLAALILAVTPISVAASRNNTMDSQLILTSLLAAWAISLAAERGRLRWLLLCALFVGVGFNIKMLQAFLVLPAFYLLYLIASPVPWRKRFVHLGLATMVLAFVSLAWPLAVDLTPSDQRPFVGSSRDNTVMELIVGHNGVRRLGQLGSFIGLDGSFPGPRRAPPPSDQPGGPLAGAPLARPPSDGPLQPPGPILPPAPDGQGQPPSGGGPRIGRQETGDPGLFRLFNEQLAGQISWLLPLAGLGLVVAAWQSKLRWPLALQHQALLLWGMWLLPQVVFFSYAGLFHRYYLEMLSPAIAALVAVGVIAMWRDYRRQTPRGWILPLALAGSAGVEALILSDFPKWSSWLTPLVLGLTLASALLLVVLRLARQSQRWWPRPVTAVGVLALLIAPSVWAFIPVWHGGDAGLPFAGPELLERRQVPNDSAAPQVSWLTTYLSANHNGEEFLVATLNARTAAPIILATGEPVMALGGFSGGDWILSAEDLAAMVADNEVRFFLVPRPPGSPSGSPGPPGQRPLPNQQNELLAWVSEHCKVVRPVIELGGSQELFDCREPV